MTNVIWNLWNMAFESGLMPEDWRSAVIVPLYKGKGDVVACNKLTNMLNI